MASLGSLQAVARGLCGDVGVGGRLQLLPDAICSGFPRRLGLSDDVAVIFLGLPSRNLSWTWPVALSQLHNDRQGHLKTSCDLSYSYATHGSSSSSRLSFCRPTIVLSCPRAVKRSLIWGRKCATLTTKAPFVYMQCIMLSATHCGKIADAQKYCEHFAFFQTFSSCSAPSV